MSDVAYKPIVTLDLASATPKAFNDTYEAFYQKTAGNVINPDLLTTGVQTITPQIAENLLLGKANRKLSVATIAYYARLMMAGEWRLNGETVIIDKLGVMRDAYHRVWACLLSNTPFTTVVVTDIDPDDATLMSIDNGKARTDVDSLQFAGLNGLSRVISGVVKIAVRHEAGYYNPHSSARVNKMSPKEVADYVRARPSLHDATHEVIAEFKETLSDYMPGKSDVACYVGWQIRDLHGVDVIEDFFTAVGEEEPVGPIALLRAKLEAEVESLAKGYRSKLGKDEALAFIIKTFNCWQQGTAMRRLVWGRDENMPDFVTPVAEDGGAEADAEALPEGVVTQRVPGQSDPSSIQP